MNEKDYIKEIEKIINTAKEAGLEISSIMKKVAEATKEKTPNVIIGYHINHHGKIQHKKPYNWHIPKRMRKLNIERGNIVEVIDGNTGKPRQVIVSDVIREESEETGVYYKQIKQLLTKNISWSELERVSPRSEKVDALIELPKYFGQSILRQAMDRRSEKNEIDYDKLYFGTDEEKAKEKLAVLSRRKIQSEECSNE